MYNRKKFISEVQILMDYNEKLYNIFSSGEQRLESWMAAVFTKEYDHNMTIDELRDILSESDEYLVVDLEEIEESNFIRDKSKWEAAVKLQYLPMVMDEEEHECGGGCSHSEGGCQCHNNEENNENEEENKDELSFYIALVDASTVTENVPEIFSVNTVREEDYNEAISKLSTIIEKEPIEKIILGLPKNMNGTIGPRALVTLEFKKKLEETFKIPVEMQDERLSTKEASGYMIKSDMSRKKRQKKIDSLAANIILKTYLDKRKE